MSHGVSPASITPGSFTRRSETAWRGVARSAFAIRRNLSAALLAALLPDTVADVIPSRAGCARSAAAAFKLSVTGPNQRLLRSAEIEDVAEAQGNEERASYLLHSFHRVVSFQTVLG
jgi:hypothetical protein